MDGQHTHTHTKVSSLAGRWSVGSEADISLAFTNLNEEKTNQTNASQAAGPSSYLQIDLWCCVLERIFLLRKRKDKNKNQGRCEVGPGLQRSGGPALFRMG